MILKVLFWVFLVICGFGLFAPLGDPWNRRAPLLVVLFLIAILGYFALGDPTSR